MSYLKVISIYQIGRMDPLGEVLNMQMVSEKMLGIMGTINNGHK